jgi:hypothetical protein
VRPPLLLGLEICDGEGGACLLTGSRGCSGLARALPWVDG